ncbi:MAG: hypothetical protein H6621_11435 [Halobacteriovoraceae bacterium]|nr:hypothetical protein [Halobacteriovoraceae bacterium]MCB9095672.1 hypothetical protein [Halobacteriovoraceae bacterium]
MHKLVLTLFFTLSLLSLQASEEKLPFDAHYGFQGRTYPALGAMVFAELGHNTLLWDKRTQDSKDQWKFGLLRPYFQAKTSVVVNSLVIGADLYPVSILGIGVGRSHEDYNFEFKFFNCNVVDCDNKLRRDFWRIKLALGYKNYVLLSHYQDERIVPANTDKLIGEYRHAIAGQNTGDDLRKLNVIFGYQHNKLLTGLLYQTANFEDSKQNSHAIYAIHQLPFQNSKLTIGLGIFENTLKGEGIGFIFRYQADILGGPKLF